MSCSLLIRWCSLVSPTRSLAEREQKLTGRRQDGVERSPKQQQDLLQKDPAPSGKEQGAGMLQEVSEQRLLRPPKKPERRRGRAGEVPAREEADESVQEQLSSEVLSEGADVAATASPVSSVYIAQQNSTSSVAEVISELPEAASSQSRTVQSLPAGSKTPSDTGSRIPSEYAQDTFESLDSTLTPLASPRSPPQGVVATSTPTPAAVTGATALPLPVGDDYTLSESLRLSESISGQTLEPP